jgi:hypothetical protein
MDKSELLQDLDNRISAAKVTGFWTQAMKLTWLNQAGQRVCDFRRWSWLELALETVTQASKEYYDYPDQSGFAFKKDSIYQIDIEDEEYPPTQSGRRRVNWTQFQKAKQIGLDNDFIFTDHNGFYFVHPIPENGKILSLYGLKRWLPLVNDEDKPISPPEYDEAIVRIALASCLRKAKKYNEAKAELVEILDPQVGVLANLWAQENDENPQGYGGEAQSSRW